MLVHFKTVHECDRRSDGQILTERPKRQHAMRRALIINRRNIYCRHIGPCRFKPVLCFYNLNSYYTYLSETVTQQVCLLYEMS